MPNRLPADSRTATNASGRRAICRIFVASFLSACLLFWWLASFLYRGILNLEDPVTDLSLGISLLSVILFLIGFAVPISGRRSFVVPVETLDICESLAYKLTLLLFLPALCLAIVFALESAGKPYNQGGTVSFADQIIYYLHLYFGFMFLGVTRFRWQAKRRVWIAIVVIILPRMIVSLHFGRAFLAQGIVPIVFIAVARRFVRLSPKRLFQIALLGLFILFVPSITRGDGIFESSGDSPGEVPPIVSWIAGGSSLQVTQDYMHLDLSHRCPPLLVSLTQSLIPYALLHRCTLPFLGSEMAADVNRLVTYEMNGADGSMDLGGAGASYLLDLYLTGGVAAIVIGSLAYGVACKFLATSIAARSLFSGIWADCLMRAVLSPRGALGYVFERVPGLVLTTLLFLLLSREFRRRQTRPLAITSEMSHLPAN